MLFYYLFPVVVLVITMMGYKKQWVGNLIFLLMLFFSMFRGDDIGTDTAHYLSIDSDVYYDYLGINRIDVITDRFEVLFVLVKYLIFSNNLSPRLLIYFFSILTILFLYLGAKRHKLNLAFVGLLYIIMSFYFLSFNIARQMAAVSICFYATSYLNEGGKAKYLFFFWVILAGLLHNSALVLLLLYFIRIISINRWNALLVCVIFYFFFIISPVTPLLIDFLSQLDIFYAFKYASGTSYGIIEKGQLQIIGTLVNGGLLFFAFYDKNNDKEAKTDLADNLFLLSLLLYSLLYYGNLATYRFTMYFTIFQFIYLTIYFINREFSKKTLFYMLIIINYYYAIQYNDVAYYMQFNL